MQLDLVAALRRGLTGRYDVAGEIGRGGMAVVCRATDLLQQRQVAIKVLYPDLARAVGGQRFLREVGILGALAHHNILPLLDSGTVEVATGLEVPWYAMPYVAADTLRTRLTREGALPRAQVIGWTRDLCAALSHAHSQGIIHRDLKPENILLLEDRAVLADFGVARALTEAGGGHLSSTGIVVGTPAYMSPEQSVGSERLDARSDLYSLGVVLYEMLAGHPPFSASTPQAVSARHQFEAPPPVGVVRPGLGTALEAAVERALAKVPADRYQSAEEFSAALAQASATPSGAGSRRQSGRWRPAVAITALLCLAILAWVFAPRLFAGAKLDPARYVVLPFHQRGPLDSLLINGGDCEQLVSDILGRIPEHDLVSGLTVAGAVAALDGPLTRDRGLALARSYGAGRVVWGELVELSDTLKVTGVLYDAATGQELRTASIRLPSAGTTIGQLSGRFADLTYRLVLPGTPAPETAAEVLGAKSFAAWRESATGDSALNAWNLPLARTRYRAALTLDPEYPGANLKLAQLGAWLDEPAQEWQPYAERAERAGDRLGPTSRRLATALAALARGDYPTACGHFRALLAQDSLEFRGWFGLGECLTSDDLVLPDTARPERWRFRASYAEGIAALQRGLTLVPATHLAYTGAGLDRLLTRLMTEPDRIRRGRTGGPSPAFFVAFPALQGDTLAFTPIPAADQVRAATLPATWAAALARNRHTLLSITSSWLSRFPHSRAAREAQAQALELAGTITGPPGAETALSLTRALRADAPAEADVPLAAREVRLLLKARQFTTARAVAESALAVPPASPASGAIQAGLAALLGRADRAADLLGQFGEREFATSSGDFIAPPDAIARDASRLLVYAAFGEPPDSLRSIEARLARAVREQVPAPERQTTLDAALFQSRLLGFPAMQSVAGGEFPFSLAERRLAEGDRKGAAGALDAMTRRRPPELARHVAPDFALLEARLWAFVGDTARARERVALLLESLDALNSEFPAQPTQAAAIGRAMRFASTIGIDGKASGIDSSLTALWRADRSH